MESPLSAPVENEQEVLADGDNLGQQEKISVLFYLLIFFNFILVA